MSISSALQTGVSGLKANSKAVGGIAENIANANTVGYKRGFAHMVTTTASVGGTSGVLSVNAVDRLDIDRVGGLIPTNNSTDLAVSGQGFFIVSASPDETIQTNYFLTRAGSFVPDKDGNLVNSAGFYLAGYPYTTEAGVGDVDRSTFSQMKTVNVKNTVLSASATSEVTVKGNLPSQEAGVATPGSPFTTSSEYFTALGEPQRISFEWQPTTTAHEWDLTVSDVDGNAFGSVTISFNDAGTAPGTPSTYSNVTNSATAPASFAMDAVTGTVTLTIDNGSTPQTLNLKLGTPGTVGGITQFAGDFSQSFDRDGSSVGALSRTEIDEKGNLYGVFDNGQRRALYEIPIALVANTNGLIELKGNAYGLSGDSGSFFAHQANTDAAGAINSGALEGSNVDIAEEMTDLIRRQRAYSTNAKVITTVDEMLEETTRLKR
jgi:flagellar hook protein FlgE